MDKTLFLLAGEASGDLQASELAKALTQYRLVGVAGPKMRAEGVESWIPMEEFQLMGFTDVVTALPKLISQFRRVRDHILSEKPDGVLLVDYGGFNVRLAASLKKHGYAGRIFYYISPKVWAWGKGRIPKIADNVDLMMAIMPFEPAIYKETTLRVEYVGNPLTQLIQNTPKEPNWNAENGLSDAPLLGLFPGSRKREIALNLPHLLETSALLKKENPNLQIALSVANEGVRPLIQKALAKHNLDILLTTESYPLMQHCRAALATSGTVTLELGLHRVPTIVVYRVSLLNAFLARYIFRINLPYYGLVNIIANDNLFQERIHTRLSPKKTAHYAKQLLEDTPKRRQVIAGCERIIHLLEAKDPAKRCAQLVTELM